MRSKSLIVERECETAPLRSLHICHVFSFSMLAHSGSHHVSIHSFVPSCFARACSTVTVVTSFRVAQETTHLKNIGHGSGAFLCTSSLTQNATFLVRIMTKPRLHVLFSSVVSKLNVLVVRQCSSIMFVTAFSRGQYVNVPAQVLVSERNYTANEKIDRPDFAGDIQFRRFQLQRLERIFAVWRLGAV